MRTERKLTFFWLLDEVHSRCSSKRSSSVGPMENRSRLLVSKNDFNSLVIWKYEIDVKSSRTFGTEKRSSKPIYLVMAIKLQSLVEAWFNSTVSWLMMRMRSSTASPCEFFGQEGHWWHLMLFRRVSTSHFNEHLIACCGDASAKAGNDG